MRDENYILAIESSCDDTSAAVLCNNVVLSNYIANQEIHSKYGGVVPEFASRAHQQNIVPVVHAALAKAGVKKENLAAIAYTKGPGLMGSLLVGSSFAKGFSMALHKPLIEVNHMQAHILAHFIDDGSPIPTFPFLCLTVSGGHTQIVLVEDHLDMKVIGSTQDDAAGEAFDKVAKILGLPYPGGKEIDQLAKLGNPHAFSFAKSKMPELDFSFSGIKTSVLYFLKKEVAQNESFVEENLADICASFQKTIIDSLLEKLMLASKKYNIQQIAIAGGVSANSELRQRLREEKKWTVYIPAFEFCTDNAAMIGIAGYYKFLRSEFADIHSKPSARLAF